MLGFQVGCDGRRLLSDDRTAAWSDACLICVSLWVNGELKLRFGWCNICCSKHACKLLAETLLGLPTAHTAGSAAITAPSKYGNGRVEKRISETIR